MHVQGCVVFVSVEYFAIKNTLIVFCHNLLLVSGCFIFFQLIYLEPPQGTFYCKVKTLTVIQRKPHNQIPPLSPPLSKHW